MKRFALFTAALGVLFGMALHPGAVHAQTGKGDGLKLTMVGVAASDFAKSQEFYEHLMGFPIAFRFGTPDRPTLFFQMGRDSFLELQPLAANAKPGLSHAHFLPYDLSTTITKLRQSGLQVAQTGAPLVNVLSAPGYSGNIFVMNTMIYDPNGIRIELNEYGPEALPRKSADAWTAAQDANGLNLNVIGVGAKDLPESAKFYNDLLKFKVAFTFGGPDPTKMIYYDQPGRDSFIELQPVAANATPGLSHFHLLAKNLDATIARLKQNGFTTAAGRKPGTMDEAPGVSPGAKTRNINVYDPDGVRIELNEYGPESLPKKAVDSW